MAAAAGVLAPARHDVVGWQPPFLRVEDLADCGGVAVLRLFRLGQTRSYPPVTTGGEEGEARLPVKTYPIPIMAEYIRCYLDEDIVIAVLVSSLS